MKNIGRCFLFLIGLTLFFSCEKVDLNDPIEKIDNKKKLSEPNYEHEYFELAYDRNYNYPDGFYYEKILTEAKYTSVYYVNTISVKSSYEREIPYIELHTLDKAEAGNWSNLTDEYSSVHRKLIQENETEKYFEFVRYDSSDDSNILFRAHRSDYFIPFSYDNIPRHIFNYADFNKIYSIGIYNGSLTVEKAKEFIEYIWVMSMIMYGKVVESTILEEADKFEHTIVSLEMAGGDYGVNDIIYVFNNKIVLDKETRVLTFVERIKVEEITGKKN